MKIGKSDVKLIQVLDRQEKDLKLEGDFKLKDSESKDELRTFISPRSRMQYQQQLDAHCAKIEETCGRLGINYNLVTTDIPIFDSFFKILEG